MIEQVTLLVFQLGIIIFAAWWAGELFRKFRLPAVLGEILAGTLIGPYALGAISLPGFHHGLFPHAAAFPVSVELYSLAVIASIILLFLVGLETDTDTFLRYSVTGSILGIGGVVVSFVAGDIVGILFGYFIQHVSLSPLDPIPLFLGVISTATSVGISARILSEHNRSNSPDGVAIISAAVIDDVLGIIALAVVVGMAKSSQLSGLDIGLIALKAIGIWLGFTVIGLVCANRLSQWLKTLRNHSVMAVLSFGMALLLAGIFESAGLAMIIGAYVMGISLSKTDLAFVIQRRMHVLHDFLVPVFFCVMGMLIDLKEITSWPILSLGSIYVLLAVISKIVGCGIPALFLNFNLRGALRIGVGMVPRGEVALIVAGIGLASGIIGHQVFSLAVFMTFITTLLAPPLLDKLLQQEGPVLQKAEELKKAVKKVRLALPNPETAELILEKILKAFEEEGHYIHRISLPDLVCHIRKNGSFMILQYSPEAIIIECSESELSFVNLLIYEVLAELEFLMKQLQTLANKDQIGRDILTPSPEQSTVPTSIGEIILPATVTVELKGSCKDDILKEILDSLAGFGLVDHKHKDEILEDLISREKLLSTGMQNGIALPHARTNTVTQTVAFLGIKAKGVEWQTLDNQPVSIVLLLLIPKGSNEPYLQTLAQFSRFLADADKRKSLLQARSNKELYQLLTTS